MSINPRQMYYRACRYSYVLSKGNKSYKDDVHSAYVYYFNKEGGNLFAQPEGYVLRCVKFMNRWRTSNESFNKEFKEWDDDVLTMDNPLGILMDTERVENIHKRILSYNPTFTNHRGEVQKARSLKAADLFQFMLYLERGYSIVEVCNLMGLNNKVASYYKRKLKEIINSMTNPFVANKLPVTKKVTRKYYEANKEKYADYEFNFDRDSDHNEHYCLVSHKEKYEGLLIIEKEKLYLPELLKNAAPVQDTVSR